MSNRSSVSTLEMSFLFPTRATTQFSGTYSKTSYKSSSHFIKVDLSEQSAIIKTAQASL